MRGSFGRRFTFRHSVLFACLICSAVVSLRRTSPRLFVPAASPRSREGLARGQPIGIISLSSVPAAAGAADQGFELNLAEIRPNGASFFDLVFGNTLRPEEAAEFDLTTEEGAQKLGLAFPIPKEAFDVSPLEYAPYFGVFLLAVAWGLFVVPQSMDRSDGVKNVYFPFEVDQMEEESEVKAAKAALGGAGAESELVPAKRLKGSSADGKRLSEKRKGNRGFQKVK